MWFFLLCLNLIKFEFVFTIFIFFLNIIVKNAKLFTNLTKIVVKS